MKPSFTLGSMLLATTMLVSPIAANAQDAPVATTPSAVTAIDDEIVVRGRNIPEPQRATSQVASFLSTDDLSRTGDVNAALALSRLSGLSVVGGKFAYVRGLGDRYSSARLNGSPLPSPEPLRRTVPLDLFPSNVLSGAVVQKTFSANYPGEFGGGIIDLTTLASPDEDFLDVKIGISADTNTTAKNGLFYHGGGSDWLGYDNGARDLPAPIQTLFASGDPLPSAPNQREWIGESIVNPNLTVIQNGTLGPNYNGTIEGGMSRELGGDAVFGFVGVVGYKQDWLTKRDAQRFEVVSDNAGQRLTTNETSMTATTNALGTFGLTWPNHEVKATLLYIHSGRKEAQTDLGYYTSQGNDRYVESTSFLERQLTMGQLAGDHTFGDFEVAWRVSTARSRRDSPYSWYVSKNCNLNGGCTPEETVYNDHYRNNIEYSDLKDDVKGAGVDIIYHVPVSGAREATLSAGYDKSKTDRKANVYDFTFGGTSLIPDAVQTSRVDYLFSPDTIDPTLFFLTETSGDNVDSYAGDLDVQAGYFQADMELIPTVRVTAGVRYEDGEEMVQTYDRFPNNGALPLPIVIDETYWLPSGMLTWNFADNMQFRVGYSQTIGRPQFRELAPTRFADPETDRDYRGSPGLIDSKFTNYDARFEYYLGRNQFITLAGFYKKIENPIEEIVFQTSEFDFNTTFINAPQANLYGGEFEYRTRFGLDWNDWFEKRDWIFSVNYTYTHSELVANAGDQIVDPNYNGTSIEYKDAADFNLDGQKLQGTPENIVNAQFGWEDDNDQLTILLGWVGERLLERGSYAQAIPDVIEKPGIQLDLSYRYDVTIGGQAFTIGLNGRNLLGTDHQEYQVSDSPDADANGHTPFYSYDRGRVFSASLTAKF